MLLDVSFFSPALLGVVAFGFGVIIGSFLNVYIYRFHTGKSLSGHSHCLSCARKLTWYELFPLVSYLGLRGRCRTCGCRIPVRYFLVELLTGLLFALSISITIDVLQLLVWWYIFSVLVVITVYDLYHFIIPDRLTIYLTIATVLLYGYRWWQGVFMLENVFMYTLSALGGTAFFLLLWVVSKGQWLGFGDVKLAFPLGLLVGPAHVFSFVVLSFWIGAGVSLLLLGAARFSRGKAGLHVLGKALTMKSAVPFAPFLVASTVVILFTHFNVLALFSFM
ncbi:MAG: prepilin peptidase [Candidatus Nomurabacteria bacterium]|nr:MAG: prepilin peptidase [Candidatus Nomurabacteria bacterium]